MTSSPAKDSGIALPTKQNKNGRTKIQRFRSACCPEFIRKNAVYKLNIIENNKRHPVFNIIRHFQGGIMQEVCKIYVDKVTVAAGKKKIADSNSLTVV